MHSGSCSWGTVFKKPLLKQSSGVRHIPRGKQHSEEPLSGRADIARAHSGSPYTSSISQQGKWIERKHTPVVLVRRDGLSSRPSTPQHAGSTVHYAVYFLMIPVYELVWVMNLPWAWPGDNTGKCVNRLFPRYYDIPVFWYMTDLFKHTHTLSYTHVFSFKQMSLNQ